MNMQGAIDIAIKVSYVVLTFNLALLTITLTKQLRGLKEHRSRYTETVNTFRYAEEKS